MINILTPIKLNNLKNTLRTISPKGTHSSVAYANPAFEIFLWVADGSNAKQIARGVVGKNDAVYFAYESKLLEPTAHNLVVELKSEWKVLVFSNSEAPISSCELIFTGIAVRDPVFAMLPCEEYKSIILQPDAILRECRITACATFNDEHFEPIGVTIGRKQT